MAIIASFISLHIFSQEVETNEILWKEGHKLDWRDFRAIPDTTTGITAISEIGIRYSTSNSGKWLIVIVEAYFNPNNSWVREDSRLQIILAHEQLHFDIAEFYARQMRQQISNSRITFNGNTRQLTMIYNSLLKEYDKTDEQYDIETNYSMDSVSQYQWIQDIKVQLDELSRYSNPVVKCRLYK